MPLLLPRLLLVLLLLSLIIVAEGNHPVAVIIVGGAVARALEPGPPTRAVIPLSIGAQSCRFDKIGLIE